MPINTKQKNNSANYVFQATRIYLSHLLCKNKYLKRTLFLGPIVPILSMMKILAKIASMDQFRTIKTLFLSKFLIHPLQIRDL